MNIYIKNLCVIFRNLIAFSPARTDTLHGKNGFVTAIKLGTANKIFVDATKKFAAATKHFVVVTKYFCYSYFNK